MRSDHAVTPGTPNEPPKRHDITIGVATETGNHPDPADALGAEDPAPSPARDMNPAGSAASPAALGAPVRAHAQPGASVLAGGASTANPVRRTAKRGQVIPTVSEHAPRLSTARPRFAAFWISGGAAEDRLVRLSRRARNRAG